MKRTVVLGLVAMLAGGCIAPSVSVIPVSHPLAPTAQRSPVELRIAQRDARTRKVCAQNLATDCLDSFWRLEGASDKQVVFRYRRVAMTQQDARASKAAIEKITLVTSDGRTARARLSDKFDVEQLEGMYWKDRALVQTGTELYARPSDGKVEKRPVYGFGTTDEATARFSGQNYVVFDGPSLITDATKWVELRWKGGLLGGGAKWRFSFTEGRAENAELSFGPEQDRPDLAKRGRVHR